MNDKELELLTQRYFANRDRLVKTLDDPDSSTLLRSIWNGISLSHPKIDISNFFNTLAAVATAVDFFREMLPFQTSLEHLYSRQPHNTVANGDISHG